ncbi:nucleotidyltransferase family protein [Ureibacillus thermosphaericus]|uniref:dTDP-glucose pyrophosphorylase n=1 Tax=Ureibacillus thermosphaericus TaxID=51173 RepID=A0A840PUX5_URETH|nr:nucleotidyltransferase family protein [Ureibacillus thermosphaericus]MBB5149733.1 dTDP-glucose pyrophosphorylase [Ureibacillus thermosphaericus]NKZ32634.1 CBS domain-containing protein [Ureibacillus thermosphaericus]
MKDWKTIIVREENTLLETMQIIDKSSLQFAVVVNTDGKLLGTVTDGDIRRSILRGDSLDTKITNVMNPSPITAKVGQSRNKYIQLMKTKKLKQLPIVDKNNKIINIIFWDKIVSNNDNLAVLMVGGLGTRLRPLTNDVPKPMLKVGGKPILETIIEGFKQYGYTNFILSVNYKKEVIQNYFQNGEAFDVNISYIEEPKRLGTAGALSLLPKRPLKPFFVMNGDLLTQVNFEQLMNFHMENNSLATMCVREYEYQIPYGVIETNGVELVSIQEKPIHKSFVNAGIYVLSPKALDYIPKNQYYDMPELFQKLLNEEKMTTVFPIREYWLDIGRMDDFERANLEYKERYE